MNTKKLVWCCAVACLLMLSGCKAFYEKQILGTWKLDTHLTNGNDDTAAWLLLFNNYSITFYDNGDFVEEAWGIANNGDWVIEKKVDGKIGEYQLRLTDSGVRVFDIRTLSKDEIDLYRDKGDGNSEEFFLERPPEA